MKDDVSHRLGAYAKWSLNICTYIWMITHDSPKLTVGLAMDVLKTLKHQQNRCRFAEEIFKKKILVWNLYFDSNFTESCSEWTNKQKASMVLIMTWRRTGDKPLAEPMLDWYIDIYMCIYIYICVNWPQWVNAQSKTKLSPLWYFDIFSWIKRFVLRFKFNWIKFLKDLLTTFVQVMARCRQTTSHYLNQRWRISIK